MHIDLTERSGLPISLDLESGELIATGDVDLGDRGERRLSQLRDVLEDPSAAIDDRICYRTYRGVGTKADLELLDKHGLRYDITVTMPGLIGREFMKTAGHYHLNGHNETVFPEVYEVVHGRGAFVLEWVGLLGGFADIPICEPKGRITIPFNCGHVTVNIGTQPLVVCDLIASECSNDYGSYRTSQGAIYYVVRSGEGFEFEPNPSHRVPLGVIHLSKIRADSNVTEFTLSDIPLIDSFRRSPSSFRFLTETTWCGDID